MKKHCLQGILIVVIIAFCLTLLSACGNSKNKKEPEMLDAPIVTLDGNVAKWSANELADKFEISVNGSLSYLENSVSQYTLTDSQTFKVRAVGNGESYLTSEWSNEVTYIVPIQKYTVVWKVDDQIIETDLFVEEGTMPSYDGETPKKASDAQYTYTFTGWAPDLVPVTNDAVYTALFKNEINTYTVKWMADDTILEIDEDVEYGTIPTFDGEYPTKIVDGHNYIFNGWDKEISEVVGNITYKAIFKKGTSYKVIFYGYNNIVLSEQDILPGESAIAPMAPQIDGYRFDGWNKPIYETDEGENLVMDIHQDTDVQAQYILGMVFTVQFINDNGMIYSSQIVDSGMRPVYPDLNPEKNHYIFKGWLYNGNRYSAEDNNLPIVVKDMTLIADYARLYTVTFEYLEDVPKENNSDIDKYLSCKKEVEVEDGKTIPQSSIPINVNIIGYTFAGWKNLSQIVIEDVTVTAEYTIKQYTVTFKMPNGTPIKYKYTDYGSDNQIHIYESDYQTVTHGNSAIAPEPDEWNFDWRWDKNGMKAYGFSGWNKSFSRIVEDTEITAVYEKECNLPVIAIGADNADSSKTAFVLSLPRNYSLMAVNLSINYKTDVGTMVLDSAEIQNASKFIVHGQLVVNKNTQLITFTWSMTNKNEPLVIGTYDEFVVIEFTTNGGAEIDENTVEFLEDCMMVISSDGGNTGKEVYPLIVYVKN